MLKHNKSLHCQDCDFLTFCRHEQACAEIAPQLSASVHKIQLKKGETLKLSQARYLYMVTEGAIKMVLESQYSNARIYGFCLLGESFGYEMFSKPDCALNVIAVRHSVLCRISLDKLGLNHAESQQKLLALMGQKLLQRTYLTYSTANGKMIGFLLELCKRHKSRSFTLPLTREGIGQHLGLATETVSRLLTKLSAAKQIALNNKQVTVLAYEQLQNLLQTLS